MTNTTTQDLVILQKMKDVRYNTTEYKALKNALSQDGKKALLSIKRRERYEQKRNKNKDVSSDASQETKTKHDEYVPEE